MLIDTHSHLSFKAYDNDRDEVLKRCQQEGLVCIDVGTSYETSVNVVALAEKNENVYSAIGLHPIHVGDEKFDTEKYKKLAKSKKIVAIGEIGLDNKYPNSNQKEIFIKQLDLAIELDLPVIIHCRMAFADLYEILTLRHGSGQGKNRGVIHCFTGTLEEAEKFMALGFYLGINGIIFKFNIDEVIKKAFLDKLLLETDCPYLTPKNVEVERPAFAPVSYGVARNEPIFVKHVAQKIADLKGISFDEVASATTQNAKKLFKI